ncbi:MAG: hypothetical protein ACRCS9_16735 [Hyphomicrobium sp.]
MVAQLGDLVDEETAALRSGKHSLLADFNYRKGHVFLEFTSALGRLSANAARDPKTTSMVGTLRAKLERNQRVLKMHLDAVNEVSATLADAIRDSESDGTYSEGFWAAGAQR